jgi:hypothetical protein
MPRVGFEPAIPASKLAKTIHALDHSTTVTGKWVVWAIEIHVSTAAAQLTQTPPCEAISESELAHTHGSPTNE